MFVGWFALSDDADKYLDGITPRITLPNSDTEWTSIMIMFGKDYVFPKPQERKYDVLI